MATAAAATRFVKYGDRKMAIDAGLTLETVKGIMARHFPELADPEVKTETKGEETVYVFAKKAGKKGARRPKHAHQRKALKQLDALETHPAVPVDIVQICTGTLESDQATTTIMSGRLLLDEAEHVATVRRALLAIQPRATAGEDALL